MSLKKCSSSFFFLIPLFLGCGSLGAYTKSQDNLPRKLSSFFQEITSEKNWEAPISDIVSFNQTMRDRWVAMKAQTIPQGSIVLDVGAGECRYRHCFSHCRYMTQDFKRHMGDKYGPWKYDQIDIESDITSIPVPSETFDIVVCTEVFEHIPDPIAATKEISRILKPGGRLILTAPFSCGRHQLPYHFYTGFTPEWYEKTLGENGLKIIEITPNGGFYKMLAQECSRVYWTWDQIKDRFSADQSETLKLLFGELLPRFLYDLDNQYSFDQFTVGYHIEAQKI